MTSSIERKMLDEQVVIESADWFTRLQDQAFSTVDMAELHAWLAKSDTHKQALKEMESVWAELGDIEHSHRKSHFNNNLTRNIFGRLLTYGKDVFNMDAWRFQPLLNSSVIAFSVGCIAILFVMGEHFQQSQWTIESTQIAEVRELHLPDGSLVTLAPNTELHYRYSFALRSLELRHGQAFFDVVRDAERPLSIAMAKTKVTVLGTQFDIVKHRSGAKISVFEGRVKVNTLRSAPTETLKTNDEEQELILTDGQALTVDKVDGQGAPIDIQPGNIGAWREGRLSYINTPLAEVIEDIGRYYPKELRLVGAGFSGLNVSATLKVDQLDTALAVLAKTLPIQFDVINDKLIVIRHKRAP